MNCERCHERPARYHVTRVVNGETVEELHLCERCAAERGEVPPVPLAAGGLPDPHAAMQQLLAGLLAGLGPQAALQGGAPGATVARSCPRCGQTYAEFARTGLVGCPECYDAFSAELEPVIRRIHGKSRHEGKVPRRSGASARRRRALEELRRELERAVSREEFERAAELRDRIHALQAAEVADGGESPPAPARA